MQDTIVCQRHGTAITESFANILHKPQKHPAAHATTAFDTIIAFEVPYAGQQTSHSSAADGCKAEDVGKSLVQDTDMDKYISDSKIQCHCH